MRLFFSILLLAICNQCLAQDKYWVFLTDKKNSTLDIEKYFDTKALQRRIKNNVSLCDSTDYPVSENYLKQIDSIATIISCSRWFNALCVTANENELKRIENLPFVKTTQKINSIKKLASVKWDTAIFHSEKLLLEKQIESMQGALFTNSNIDGKGVRVAIFDAGFPALDKNSALNEIYKSGRIIKTYDFVKKREDVNGYSDHGTLVMSCIGGKLCKQQIGLAPGAEFLLARTEQAGEPLSEEENWLAAVEWADKNGADIINSSLGYTNDRYFVEEMNGNKSLVARAANMAAAKGILVVNSIGNDGDNSWRFAGTPADADSVLSVGGIDPETGLRISFSSFGPTSKLKMKPNVVAFGTVATAGKKSFETAHGTSFSSPLVAGFAACIMQMKPELKTMEIFREIEKSAHLYPYFDYAHGYGIPQASYFFKEKVEGTEALFTISSDSENIKVEISDKLVNELSVSPKYLYYHIANNNNILLKYAVIKAYKKEALTIPVSEVEDGRIIRVYFMGTTRQFPEKSQ